MRADDPPRFRFMRLRGRAAAGSEITDVVALLRMRFPKGRLVRKPAEWMEYKDRKDKKEPFGREKRRKGSFHCCNFCISAVREKEDANF
jgi:hypothetical protein